MRQAAELKRAHWKGPILLNPGTLFDADADEGQPMVGAWTLPQSLPRLVPCGTRIDQGPLGERRVRGTR